MDGSTLIQAAWWGYAEADATVVGVAVVALCAAAVAWVGRGLRRPRGR